ncbi:exosome complex component RRP42 [Striga asiatica]|uniref:Ribosomal RNA-processing protein 42 n=1 Tax=Striga asiatica TaxID=4170 RepID=A0A5A7R1H9_STRAF|nr:exosome complex component RRP42 [Striga asiatica]
MTRWLSRSLAAYQGAGIDLSSLSIVEGKICWDLYIDGLVVSSDGNILDALGAAIKAALSNTAIPKVQVAANAPSDEQPEVDVTRQLKLPRRKFAADGGRPPSLVHGRHNPRLNCCSGALSERRISSGAVGVDWGAVWAHGRGWVNCTWLWLGRHLFFRTAFLATDQDRAFPPAKRRLEDFSVLPGWSCCRRHPN